LARKTAAIIQGDVTQSDLVKVMKVLIVYNLKMGWMHATQDLNDDKRGRFYAVF
jgi:hypothetical protein